MTIINPQSIGNPDEEPIVEVDDDLMALFAPCRAVLTDDNWCGGVNGFHRAGCTATDGSKRSKRPIERTADGRAR